MNLATMIQLAIAIGAIVASYAIMKTNVKRGIETDDKHENRLKELEEFKTKYATIVDHLSGTEEPMKARIEKNTRSIVRLESDVGRIPTMTAIREELVSKDLFMQMEDHFNDKLKDIKAGIAQILEHQQKRKDD